MAYLNKHIVRALNNLYNDVEDTHNKERIAFYSESQKTSFLPL